MHSLRTSLLLPFIIFVSIVLIGGTATAQIRKGGTGRKGSLYMSAGYNKSWFNRPDIQVDQPTLGNSYKMLQVKADNVADSGSLIPWQLNYRLGYYFGYYQTWGLELCYDPANFHIAEGPVHMVGTFDGIPNVDKTVLFTKANGYFYQLSRANLLLLNFVRRFGVYAARTNNLRVDGLAKLGAGPVMPRFQSSFGSNPYDDKQFQLKGWNAALEGAARVTFYRYVYLEFAAKYDYAMYDNLKVFGGGVAKTNIGTLQLIGSLGFTFPTTRFNPLFYHPHKIITITPLYLEREKKLQEKLEQNENAESKKKKKKNDEEETEIPDFNEVTPNKKERREPKPVEEVVPVVDSAATGGTPETTEEDGKKKKKKKKKKKDDSAEEAPVPEAAPEAPKEATDAQGDAGAGDAKGAEVKAPEANTEPPAPDAGAEPDKKALKALEKKAKQEKKDQEKREKEEQKAKEKREKEEQKAQQKKEQEEQEKADNAVKSAEEQAEQERKDAEERAKREKKEAEDRKDAEKNAAKDKIEQAKKEREEKLEQAKKEREEKAEQAKKEREELKAKREKELQELKEKREKELQELKEKREKEKEEREKKKE